MNIGEKLEEARKRKGVTIREAAEATKVRSDFLLAMENNSFDTSLPEIYTRGFLKIYGTFLKLDTEKLMTDYDAHRMSGRKTDRRQTNAPMPRRDEPAVAGPRKPSFGRMDLPEAQASPSANTGAVAPGPSSDNTDDEDDTDNRALYYKLGLGIAGVALLVLIIVLIVSAFSGDDTPQINPDLQPGSNLREVTPAAAPASGGPFELVASDFVTVIVTSDNSGERLIEGTLSPGERRTIQASGPVTIRYTRGDALIIERGGRSFRMGSEGSGITRIN